ncbi:MAG: HDOD domain-containing protein [Sulfuricella sp.]|nr:HDOD domain-containing protein [Sulfuricella sp.]
MKPIGEWLDELKARDLPVLRRTITELGKLAAKAERVSAGQIAETVLRDPLMTLKVLRLVNGMSRSRLSNEITTIEHAVVMMGVIPFFNRHVDLKAVEDSLADGALSGLMQVLSRAHHAAWQARDWAILHADMKSEEVYIGALLYDLGEIVLWCCAPDLAGQILKQSRRNKTGLVDAEKAVLGFDLRELQFALAEAWNLPELMQSFMHAEGASRPRMLGVIMAASVARHAESGWRGALLMADYEVIAHMLHASFDQAVENVQRNAIVVARHWEWYGVPPSASWLPMLPGEWPAEPDDEAEPSAEEEEPAEACLMPRADVLRQIMGEISAHLDGTLNLHDMMSLVLKGMHQGIGLNRVVFALMTADRSALKAKYVIGAEAGSPLQQFNIDLGAPQLFCRLMEKVQSLWFSEQNRKVLEPMIPFATQQMIGHGDFFAMSLFVHGKPVGLFYADRKHGECALDEHSYQGFKALCLRAAEGLAHLARK